MQDQQLFLLTCLLGLPVISAIPLPQVLFRDSALVHQASHSHRTPLGLVSHNSHSVQDSNSAVHRHHTQATNHAGRLHHTLLSSPLPQVSHSVLQAPSLVQHADGRFFAVNTNIQPGQFFQNADGRIFRHTNSQTTLVAPAPSAPVAPTTAPLAPVPVPSDDNAIIAAKDSSDDVEAIGVSHVMETTLEPVTEAPAERADPISQPQTARVIATAPFTASTARFVSAVPAISQAPIPVTHISHNSPFLTNFAPSSHIIQDLRSVQAVPTSQLGHAVHVLPARVPISPATRGHLLADSSTNVFTGYFSSPNYGIDFNF